MTVETFQSWRGPALAWHGAKSKSVPTPCPGFLSLSPVRGALGGEGRGEGVLP
jgi:hypothetical protein